MQISSKVKKSISTASLLAMSALGASAGQFATSDEALDKLTGPNQPRHGNHSLCVKVSPYFLSGISPEHLSDAYIGMRIDGIRPYVNENEPAGQCAAPNEANECERGFVLITSTVALLCHVPVSL